MKAFYAPLMLSLTALFLVQCTKTETKTIYPPVLTEAQVSSIRYISHLLHLNKQIIESQSMSMNGYIPSRLKDFARSNDIRCKTEYPETNIGLPQQMFISRETIGGENCPFSQSQSTVVSEDQNFSQIIPHLLANPDSKEPIQLQTKLNVVNEYKAIKSDWVEAGFDLAQIHQEFSQPIASPVLALSGAFGEESGLDRITKYAGDIKSIVVKREMTMNSALDPQYFIQREQFSESPGLVSPLMSGQIVDSSSLDLMTQSHGLIHIDIHAESSEVVVEQVEAASYSIKGFKTVYVINTEIAGAPLSIELQTIVDPKAGPAPRALYKKTSLRIHGQYVPAEAQELLGGLFSYLQAKEILPDHLFL